MKIYVGNNYDAAAGSNHTYAYSAHGYDVRIEDAGIIAAYRLRYLQDGLNILRLPIPQKSMADEVKTSWDELPDSLRKKHFDALYPDGDEEQKNLFVYGEEEGARINALNKWADTHTVFSREITLGLQKKLGYFKKVEHLKSYARQSGTGYKNHEYVIDGKWLVIVYEACYDSGSFYDNYEIRDYTKIVADQKAFGQRVARLAKAAGVPWDIGVFVGHIETDEEAIDVLKRVKAIAGTADHRLQRELQCGIARRCTAINEMLGKELFAKLSCSGQRQTTTLAHYLLGE